MLTVVSTMLRMAQAPAPGTSPWAASAGDEAAAGAQLPYQSPTVVAAAINLMPGKVGWDKLQGCDADAQACELCFTHVGGLQLHALGVVHAVIPCVWHLSQPRTMQPACSVHHP
jgi:hypothetical protein